MSHNDILVNAGAIVPVDAEVSSDTPTDLVSARAYASPVLGDRVIVRLTSDSLAPGEDLAMEFLGLGAPTVTGPLGKQRRRALGFPGWALIHDPDHAAFALEVVKEFKKHARRASSKPGFAKEGFDAIGDKLGRSVPHFLPSYWEEVGRAFLDVGSTTYASQAFNKAREAERVHALEVDESLRRETFLEFALAGALAVKALGAYAKDLATNYDPQVAYGHFRELCVRRTLGGIPPWSAMGKELRRLMKGAKLKPGPEEQSLVRELLGASSLTKAPVGFWKHYAAAFAAVAKDDAEVRGQLLNLFPGQNEKSAYYLQWLDLLDTAGALDSVTVPDASSVPEAARPTGSAAAWLSKAMESMTGWWNSGYPHRLFEIARRMAPRLIADGIAVDCSVSGTIHIDMADLLLELGVPVADPGQHDSVDLRRWARKEDDGPDRQRALDFVAADDRFIPLLRDALDNVFGEDDFERVAAGKSGLFQARAEWLEARTRSLLEAPLPDFEESVGKLVGVLRESLLEEFPEAIEKLGAVEATGALTRTLKGGIVDEFGWPLLEAEVARLVDEDGGRVFISGAFPTLVIASTKRAVALDGSGRLAEHELRLPKDTELRVLRYLGGQFLVVFGESWRSKFYWSDKPSAVKEFEGYFYSREHPADAVGIDVPGGGITEGRRALMPGDSKPGNFGQRIYSDGDTFWWFGWTGSEHACSEFDPKTGESGRKSWPAFFEDYGREDRSLRMEASSLYPVPEAAQDSPLGPRGGFFGWRVRSGEGVVECEGIDGRSLRIESDTDFEALATWPGGGGLPLSTGSWPEEVTVWDTSGQVRLACCELDSGYRAAPRHAPGQSASLPLPWWHYFSARDVDGSKALRDVSPEAVAAILVAAREDLADEPDLQKCEWSRALAAVTSEVPTISSDRLRLGVAGLAGLCAAGEAKLRDRIAEVGGTGELPTAVLGAFVESGEERVRLPDVEIDLSQYASLGAAAFSLALDQTGALDGSLAVLKTAARSPLGTLDVPTRYISGAWTGAAPSQPERYHTHWWGLVENGNRYVVSLQAGWSGELSYRALEFATSGSFAPLEGADIENDRSGGWRGAAIEAFLDVYAERGPVPLDASVGAFIAERTGLSPRAALLLWLGAPKVDVWESNYLPKPLREALGWKVKEAKEARVELKGATDRAQRARIYELSMPDNPVDLWDAIASGAAQRFADAFDKVVGKRVSLDPAVVADAARRLDGWQRSSASLLPEVIAPEGSRLTNDGDWRLQFDDGSFEVTDARGEEASFATSDVRNAAIYIPFLFQLPVGHPMRAAIPGYLELVRERLRSPTFLVHVDGDWHYSEDAAKVKGEVEKYMRPFQGQPYECLIGDEGTPAQLAGLHAVDTGALLVAGWYDPSGQAHHGRTLVAARVRALLDDPTQRARFAEHDIVVSAGLVESDAYAAMAARVTETPVPESAYEQNPAQSVPDLVAEVAKALEIGEEPAALYLQVLTLMEPTTKNLRIWNGWTAARLKKAFAVLEGAGLVLEAKRARAGRNHFLPGGWMKRSAPRLPYETWKEPLYGLRDGAGPLEDYLPLEPFHVLFAKAWQRVKDGDKPEYEEV